MITGYRGMVDLKMRKEKYADDQKILTKKNNYCRKMRMEKNKQNKDVRFMLYVTEAALLWYQNI